MRACILCNRLDIACQKHKAKGQVRDEKWAIVDFCYGEWLLYHILMCAPEKTDNSGWPLHETIIHGETQDMDCSFDIWQP